ncbi:MAG: transglutaminase family protein [Rhizobiaceae bacterium]|nr:transglutaminase family protein [Rhizobiaceae bacterium]
MILDLKVHLHYRLSQSTDLLLQIEAADLPDQVVEQAHIDINETEHLARVNGDDAIGERIWLRVKDDFICDYSARIRVDRPALRLEALDAVPPHLLPGDTVRYLMPSRYCPADEFHNFIATEFADLKGGAMIAAMRDWIHAKFQYVPGSSNAQTTALDTFVQRQGVCRDYAHVMIAFARASAIPARFASVYAPYVTPQDFHAVAEIYLDGTWHLVDPTGMADASQMARIGVGPDAASVAFMSSFGQADFVQQSVGVEILPSPA